MVRGGLRSSSQVIDGWKSDEYHVLGPRLFDLGGDLRSAGTGRRAARGIAALQANSGGGGAGLTGLEKQKDLARHRVQQAEESLEFRPLAHLRLMRRLKDVPGIRTGCSELRQQ